jgi:hypothetical protein
MLAVHKFRWAALVFILIVPSLVRRGEAQQPTSQGAAGDMADPVAPRVSAQETPRTFFFVHWNVVWRRDSKEQAVQQIVDEMQESLRSKGVLFASDPLRKSHHSPELLSIHSLLNMAKDIEASHLLYLSIWPRATLQCFDLSGRMVWEEVAKGARAAGLPEHNVRVMMKRLRAQLEPRIGTDCLQVAQAPDADHGSAVVETPH